MARDVQTKREREKALVSDMIALYCKKQHGTKRGLCPECAALTDYARQRSDKCPFIETKTFCSNCKVHCYAPEMREKIRVVMRFSGPRMLFHHPVAAVRHVIETKKERLKSGNGVMENFRVGQAAFQRGLESPQHSITPLPDYSLTQISQGEAQ